MPQVPSTACLNSGDGTWLHSLGQNCPGPQVSVCSHQLLERGGCWNVAPSHPGLTQPGISHTHSLTSFSVYFIPLPTQCLLKSLLHQGKHETGDP